MFASNLAIWDRILRVVIGLALIAGFFLLPELSFSWAFWVGVIPLLSGLIGRCPVYRLLGWSTRDGGGGGAAHA